MKVSSVKIRNIFPEDERLAALLSVTIDQEFVIHDVKIIKGDTRVFVAMPSKKDKLGGFHDIVHPISTRARSDFEKDVIALYYSELEKSETGE